MASLLTPAAVMACVLTLWRLAADLNFTGQFPIADGLFSHWQVWLTVAATLQFSAILLNRYGETEAVLPETVDRADRKLASSRLACGSAPHPVHPPSAVGLVHGIRTLR